MNLSNYETSYRAAHKFIPSIAFESNVSSLDPAKELMPNNPNLKQWNYDTSTNINFDYKFDTMDPIHRPIRINFNKTNYIMPQWEKYWLNTPKPMKISLTEYNDKYSQPSLMSTINQTQIPSTCVQPKIVARTEIVKTKIPKISDMGVIRKMDPYTSTQKLAYTEINPIMVKQLNFKQSKQKQILPEYESFYNEPIFKRQNTIRLLPNTMKHVPHNALKSEMKASYKLPINTLSNIDDTVEMPISISRNPTLSQILSIPKMYTSEYSRISGNK